MAISSNIEWTDATWNPWVGCTKVSPACTNCYMFRDMRRYGRDPEVVNRSKNPTFFLPLKRRRPLKRGLQGNYCLPTGFKVFTCSWSDWFHQAADEWRPEAWRVVRQRPDLIFQILTKRPERIAEHLPDDWGQGYANVWLGVTAEDQQRANERVPILRAVRARVRFMSSEPLLSQISLIECGACDQGESEFDWEPRIDWIIAGGESGPNSRPSHPDWFRSLRDQCQAAGVAFFFKQWGEYGPDDPGPPGPNRFRMVKPSGGDRIFNENGTFTGEAPQQEDAVMFHVGKKAAGRLLDGREWSDFPVVSGQLVKKGIA